MQVCGKKCDYTTGVFYITYACNDNCDFCFVRDKLNKGFQMTVDEIKDNFFYFQKKHAISCVILSGGEPTLHSDFFEILGFFLQQKACVSLNTNSFRFSDTQFVKKLESVYAATPQQKNVFALSLTTFDDKKIESFLQALELAFRQKIKVIVVINVTQQNYEKLSQLGKTIVSMMSQFENADLTIQLRGLYLGKWMQADQIKKTVPPSFAVIRPFLEKTLNDLIQHQIKIRLFNLPFCYFKSMKHLEKIVEQSERIPHELRVHIDHEKQFLTAESELFHGETWELESCKTCLLEAKCNKIQPEYLKNKLYPSLTPFV